jgi:hypothetical protein
LRRASLAQQHLPLDIPEADVQAINRPNDAASRRRHQNRQQHEFCLPFAAASTDPADSTCVASITLASLKADRSTCKAAPKQAANQVASQSIIRMRRRGMMVITTGEWLLAIAGHTSTLGSSHALLSAVSASQALLLLPESAQAATHATRYFSPTSLFVGPTDPNDVWYCRNLRPATCEGVPVWRCVGRGSEAC